MRGYSVFFRLIGCFFLLQLFFSACTYLPSETSLKSVPTVVESCKSRYNSAQKLQRSGHFCEAIDHYKEILQLDDTNEEVQAMLQPIVVDAMLQLMNCYQSNSDPNGCVAYLYGLQTHSTSLIRNYCQRDLTSLLAYAVSRTEAMEEAEQLMEQALQLPFFSATPQLLFRDYAYAAAVFFSNPLRQEDVISWSLLALEQAKLYENPSGVQWIYSLLGTLYKRTGRINEAADLLLQSVDEARTRRDVLGEMNAYNALTTLYLYWDLPTYANSYATLAVNKVGMGYDSNPTVAGRSYLLKAKVMNKLTHPDSALLFLSQAEEQCLSLPYNSGQVDIDCLLGELWLSHDSMPEPLERLERVAREATPMNRAKSYQLQAQYYQRKNQEGMVHHLLDSMYNLLHLSSSPLYLEGAHRFALSYYLGKNDLVNVERFANALLSESTFLEDRPNAKKLAETVIRFQTEKKEQKLQMLQVEAANTRLTYRIYAIALSALSLLLVGFLLYKRNIDEMERKLTEQQLSTVLDRLQLLQQHSSQIEQQLQESYQDSENRMKLEAVAPSLLKERGEEIFRDRFSKLYPYFLFKLREKVPNVGRKEELLAMLIALKQDSHQIEVLMGIAHRSVNMARYRLRQKFNLKTEQRLEDEIEALLL